MDTNQGSSDLITQIDAMKAELAALREQQATAQTTNELLQQLVEKIDGSKGSKIWVDKPDKFNGKIGEGVNNWLNGWELWFEHREKQDGKRDDPRLKIETAMQSATEKVKGAMARHERDHGRWTTWKQFKKDMRAKYTSTDSEYARFAKLTKIQQRKGESVESYYQRFSEELDNQKCDDDDSETEIATTAAESQKVKSEHNNMFVHGLHDTIKPSFLRLPAIADGYQKKDLYELRQLATRVEESISPFTESLFKSELFAGVKSKGNGYSNSKQVQEILQES